MAEPCLPPEFLTPGARWLHHAASQLEGVIMGVVKLLIFEWAGSPSDFKILYRPLTVH